MPIRFRCAYCNQLLGIAKRKSGAVIRCPTCAGQVIVPKDLPDEVGKESGSENPFVFERNDFEDILLGDANTIPVAAKEVGNGGSDLSKPGSAVADAPAGAWGTFAEPSYDVKRLPSSPVAVAVALPGSSSTDLVLNRQKLVLALSLVLVGILLSFFSGMALGYWLRGPGESAKTNYDLESPFA